MVAAALPFKELSRQYTPCAWALVPDAPEVLFIEDLTQDARSASPAFSNGCVSLELLSEHALAYCAML